MKLKISLVTFAAWIVASTGFSAPIKTLLPTGQVLTKKNLSDIHNEKEKKADDGVILPVANTIPTMMMAILSSEPSQATPQPLSSIYKRFHNLPDYIQQEIYNFYEENNFSLVWIKDGELTQKAKDMRESINEELYYTTPVSSKIFTLTPTKSTDIELVDFEMRFTLNILQKVEYIRNGITNLSGVYGISENGNYKILSPLTILNNFYHNDPKFALNGLLPKHPYYIPMREEVKRLQNIMNTKPPALIQSNRIMKLMDSGEDVKNLIHRLTLSGDLPQNYPTTLFDETVLKAVQEFQKRHGETADGAVGYKTLGELNRPVQNLVETLLINFERIRKMDDFTAPRYLRVNVPEFRLRFYEASKPTLDMAVIVGRKSRPTPIFSDEMSYIDFNPYWNIPYSLAVKDILPKAKKNPLDLVHKKIRAFQGNKEVSVLAINWDRYNEKNFPYYLRQDSGKDNALGTVKFMFPNHHAVYLHDTPTKNLFSHTMRSESSGCVRVAEPAQLAETLLKGIATRQRIDEIFASQKNKAIRLSQKVPVSLEYLTASAPIFGSNQIRYNKDIYDYDAQLLSELRRQTNYLMATPHP